MSEIEIQGSPEQKEIIRKWLLNLEIEIYRLLIKKLEKEKIDGRN